MSNPTPPQQDIYDLMAPFYREYSDRKRNYLQAVDRFVVEHLPPQAGSMLDVGSGDGVRGMSIARIKSIPKVVLVEPSSEMAKRCRELGPTDVWQVAAEELPDTAERFEVITCLWNVLGHLGGRRQRVQALVGMKRLLADSGIILFDVNNRHNAAAYGWLKVLGRRIADGLAPDERRGDATFTWTIGDQNLHGKGHLFTPAEIEGIVREAGLNIRKRVAINYSTGVLSSSPTRGQLLYIVAK